MREVRRSTSWYRLTKMSGHWDGVISRQFSIDFEDSTADEPLAFIVNGENDERKYRIDRLAVKRRNCMALLCYCKTRLHPISDNFAAEPRIFIRIFRVHRSLRKIYFIIARQHAEHDIIIANPSVCPSVQPMPVLCLNEWTYGHTF